MEILLKILSQNFVNFAANFWRFSILFLFCDVLSPQNLMLKDDIEAPKNTKIACTAIQKLQFITAICLTVAYFIIIIIVFLFL